MKKLLIACTVVLADGTADERRDRFKLLNYCDPVFVGVITVDTADIGLSKTAIKAVIQNPWKSAASI